ncbi:glutamate receptor-interacting protein 2-like protein, partial [Aphelenchoides avenae]
NRSDTFPDGSPTYLHYHDGTYQDGTVEGSVRSADALLAGVLDATTSVHGSSRAGSSGGGRGGGPRGLVAVKLQRKNGAQLGLGIAGGSDRPIAPTISFLRPGFIAHRCDQLQVGL